jgi:hypothetical protein
VHHRYRECALEIALAASLLVQNGRHWQNASATRPQSLAPFRPSASPAMNHAWLTVLAVPALLTAAEPARRTLWEGTLHLGDTPAQYSNVNSGGMLMQIPCTLAADHKGKLTITTCDVQTLAGEGHYAELLAHYEDGDAPAREYVVETFRLKGDSTNADIEHTFDIEPMKGLQAPPAYYSIRVRIDTQIKFTLWDDFLVKRIQIEQ